MTAFTIFQLAIATALPPLASIVLMQLDLKYSLSKRNYWFWQTGVGTLFGLIAIFGTEFGILTVDATMNVRDAAPLVAGLIFGPPAGIIAGVIGGVERWFAALWGRGMFTRLACSLGTILSGLYAAAVRILILDDEQPNTFVAMLVGFVDEVLHLLLVLFTNLNSAQLAFMIVKACSIPMVLCVGISTGAAAFLVSSMREDRLHRTPDQIQVTESVQNGMLVVVVIAFALTSGFSALLHNRMSEATTMSLLSNTIVDVRLDIEDATRDRLEKSVGVVRHQLGSVEAASDEGLARLQELIGLEEISLVDPEGIIVKSTNPSVVGKDTKDDEPIANMLKTLDSTWSQAVVTTCKTHNSEGIPCQFVARHLDGGTVIIAYDESSLRELMHDDVERSAVNRHIGESGFVVMADDEDELLYHLGDNTVMEDAYATAQKQLFDTVSSSEPGTLLQVEFMGDSCYVMGGEAAGYRIVAVYPEEEANQARDTSVLIGSFAAIIIFAMLFTAIYVLIKADVVDGVRRVNERLLQITDGNLDVVVDERSSLEFAQLSDGINQTVDALKRHIEEAAARIDQDLEYARSIQASALPSVFPPYPQHDEFEIYASMRPAKLVGGDFYDFYLLDENRLAFLVADVSGKSIPGAMFMMRAKTIIRSYADQGYPVNDILWLANDALCEGNESNMFVTSWMGVIDLQTGHVCAANAGHNLPLLCRSRGGSFEYLNLGRNLILGCMEGVPYRLLEFDMLPGDVLFLYTDGVVEANNIHDELFGDDRLQNTLNELGPQVPMQSMCEVVLGAVDTFAGEQHQYDDITMLALKYYGSGVDDDAERGSVLEVEARTKNIDAITAFVEEHLEALDCPLKTQIQIDVALDEVFANICNYAYPNRADRPAWVRFETFDEGRKVRITFEDEGIPFNPLLIPAPDTTLSLEERGIGGYGIFIVRRTMDEVTYERHENRNVLSFTKVLA